VQGLDQFGKTVLEIVLGTGDAMLSGIILQEVSKR